MIDDVQDLGFVKISDEVVATAAGIAALQVAGVHKLVGTIREGLEELLGKNPATRGVSVQMGEDLVDVTLTIEVDDEVRIPDLVWKVKQNARRKIEHMTGLRVREVNVNVRSVAVPKNIGEKR